MTRYLITRILALIPVLFFVALITFIIMHATPGGPWDTDPASRTSDPRVSDRLNREFGLDKPLFVNTIAFTQAQDNGKNALEQIGAFFDGQFENYMLNLVQGNLGPSYRYRGREVNDILFGTDSGQPAYESRFFTTVTLGVIAMIFALLIGFPLGLISALKQNTWLDHLSLFVATVGYGIPNFVMGIFLIIVFAVWLGVVKVIELDYWTGWKPWILPALALAIPVAAFIARLTRASVLETMRQDYIRTARSKGLTERAIIFRHMLKNSMIPVITFIGPAFAGLVTGSFIIESQFLVTGIGRLFVESIFRRDYTVIMALTLIYAALIALANLLVDIVYTFLDPRITLTKSSEG